MALTRDFRWPLRAAALFGAGAVALGAWGAHAGAQQLDAAGERAWQTAVHYQALHALALLGLAALRAAGAGSGAGQPLRWAANAWTAGTLAFSGSLYGLALGGPRWLGPVTPLGGVGLLVGWLALLLG